MVGSKRVPDIWTVGYAMAMRTLKQRLLEYLLLLALIAMGIVVLLFQATEW